MDSLSQIALGASVSVAAMGSRAPLGRVVLWGAIAGTLPDLDAFIDYGDAVLNMTRHRAESHSLLYVTLAAPLLAWLVSRIHREPHLFGRWCLALWAALFTHPILDWFTVYGTQLFQPFTDRPYGLGSIFIIDPLFTLPLLFGLFAAALFRSPAGRMRANAIGLALALFYLGGSAVTQYHVTTVARKALPDEARGQAHRLLVTPSPFNTVLWRLVLVTEERYYEGWYSLLDREGAAPVWRGYDRGAGVISRHGAIDGAARIAAFSHGFFSMDERDGRVYVTDLRMGQEPFYTFRFDVGAGEGHAAIARLERSRPPVDRALPWLWARMLGDSSADSQTFTVGGRSPSLR
jgi:inner membrane protein